VTESNVFLETYLREIGVHTPVSLLSFGLEKTDGQDAIGGENIEPSTGETNLKGSDPTIADSTIIDPAIVDPIVDPIVEADANHADASGLVKTLDVLWRDAATCKLCALADTRQSVVFGAGDAQADLLFVGEAPGQDEDAKGEPFVGSVGGMLDRMLLAMGLSRDRVYVMNSIKCRPPNNRDPRPDEVQACNLWFEQQLDILQPKIICLLGRVAAQTVLNSDETLASLRGHWHDYQGIPVWVTYHPAYLMRSPRQKQKSWQDLRQLSLRMQAL